MGTVFITGGSGKLGRETARIFAQNGHDVALSYQTNTPAAEQIVAEVKQTGRNAVAVKMDMGFPKDIDRAFEKVTQHFENLDYLVNNISLFNGFNPSRNQTWQMWERILSVNLIGQWYCTRLALTEITKTGGGAVVYNASLSGLTGIPYAADFVASKWALIGMAKSLALEYAAHNVRINVICPGFFKSRVDDITPEKNVAVSAADMIPAQRVGEAREIAKLLYWLAVENTYCYGATLVADGGITAGAKQFNGHIMSPVSVKSPEDTPQAPTRLI